MSLDRVINVWAEQPDLTPLEEPNPQVQKIIIGQSPSNSPAAVTPVISLPLFEADYKGLTHLYLWSTSDLTRIPGLSARQQVLEIRDSRNLTTIDTLPRTLRTLILEVCPQLDQLPPVDGEGFPDLVELSLARCTGIDPAWINRIISQAPNLQKLDLSGCSQVTLLPPRLPRELERLELNHCTSLESLPKHLPYKLRRLGLRGATKLGIAEQFKFPDLPRRIDYVDLAETHSLTVLPKFPPRKEPSGDSPSPRPRTLFLYGSAVLEPPASEHGDTPETNVARETREYQDEVELVGRGTVRRCKLLLLGNGSAGKTTLALNLNPHFNREPRSKGGDYHGTTHGVQFWDWPDFEATDGQENSEVHLHLWDFGGQEIYHSTHRIFVSRGSVFLLLWNPEQDGQTAPQEGGYQDVWYPVRYWLDYIHMECPHNRPLVAIVCSHQGDRWQPGNSEANQQLKQELQDRLRRDIGDDYAKRVPLFVLDSERDLGERKELEEWLQRSVLKVVRSQGTVVPTYWEIAQDMVEKWLPAPRSRPTTDPALDNDNSNYIAHKRLTFDKFSQRLRETTEATIQNRDASDTDFTLLEDHWDEGKFLTEHRVRRALRFLTHSGWLYWNSQLFESQVIIDQPWALETVYAALDRRTESSVFKKLSAAKGRFTFPDLQEWSWKNESLSEDDQHLIMSFMTSVGVCFELNRDYSSRVTEYISPTHLPESDSLIGEFRAQYPEATGVEVKSPQLHRGHWSAILRELCKRYGTSGTWTKNACRIAGSSYRWNREDKPWQVLLQFQLDDETKGLGGKILLSAVGEGVTEHLPKLEAFVRSFLPGFEGNASDACIQLDQTFQGFDEDAPTVFFSFAWDPVDRVGYYEAAVDAVYDALKPYERQGRVRLLRDKYSISEGEYISRYIQKAGSEDVTLVLVFSSEKYWRSWFCMAEFRTMIKSLSNKGKSFQESVLLIEHETGRLQTADELEELERYWEGEPNGFPASFRQSVIDKNLLQKFYAAVLREFAPTLTSDMKGLQELWSDESSAKIIDWVKRKLNLPTSDESSRPRH